MPSDDKKKRDAKKKAQQQKSLASKGKIASSASLKSGGENLEDDIETTAMGGEENGQDDEVADELAKLELEKSDARTVTGVLTSFKQSRDVHLASVSLTCFGQVLLEDATLELNNGRRYGFIGPNGCGKSTLMAAMANRELPIPEHIDIYYLSREMPPSEKTALESVIDVDKERAMLENEAAELASATDEESQERLMDIYDRLEFLDADKAAARAAAILHGLGFKKSMQSKKVKDFSGGWRMRIALARALYVRPSLLLMDEPTNHLDLAACCWLEEELKEYKRILVIVSHSQDFLNGVCTNIIHMHNKKLKVYGGNYDQYVQTRFELETNQMKKFKWEQNKISQIKDFVARFGHGTKKLARQAQSREKMLARMTDAGLTESVTKDRVVSFHFPDCGTIPPPVIMVQNVSFRYSEDTPLIYQGLEFGFDLDSRVALVGPNGAGKSTLLKLIYGDLTPTSGLIRRHSHLKCVRYNQHLTELLDLDQSALEWSIAKFPDMKEVDDHRKLLGRFGLTGNMQTSPMRVLSDGQRCRVVFAYLSNQAPHLILLDEPTNHLDIETIDALADSINDFEGGVVLVSHDFRLISQVAEEIWICDKGKIDKWDADIYQYKQKLMDKVRRLNEKHKVL